MTAKAKFVVDEPSVGIQIDQVVSVQIDGLAIESEADLIEAVEDELETRYGLSFIYTPESADDGDFFIENLDELMDELAW